MNSELTRHSKALTVATNALLAEVSPLSSSTYYFRPGEGRWSISQILTHLVTSERLSLNYMKKKSQTPVEQLGTANLLDDVWFFVFGLSQQIPLRYKAPKIVLDNTPNPLSFGELVRQWDGLRLELADFLNTLESEKIQKKIYKHPIAGRLSVILALRFMVLHLKHHLPQVRAIIAQQRKSKIPVA